MAGTDTEHSTAPRPSSPISLTNALRLALSLQPDWAIDRIAQDFTNWVRGDYSRLWCNGNLVPASFSSTSLVMVARVGTGGPHLDAVPAGGIGWDPKAYNFELDADAIVARLSASATLSRQQYEPAKKRRQPQSNRVRWAFLRLFPNGQIPSVYTSILERDIIRELTSDAGKEARMDGKPYPSPDVIDRVRNELSY
jgi:hypothetical protein